MTPIALFPPVSQDKNKRADKGDEMGLNRELEGITVVALEQAVAAPYCSLLLADAGARVIKLEQVT